MAATAVGLPASTAWATQSSSGSAIGQYIVIDHSSSDASASSADVGAVGGQLLQATDLTQSVTADLSFSQVGALAALASVQVVPDLPVSVQDASTTSSTRAPAAVFPQQTGATSLWAQGDTGQGVNVAVVDTGIDNLPDFAGRLVDGVDLSGEGNPFQDSYGHGTFVAGLIAGNGTSSNGTYMGEAPGAGLVSVKVAGASGSTDLATVIKGIDWVIAHKASDGIAVLNLSFGVPPFTSVSRNPLDQAVEAAWQAGIVVVAAAGNAGPFNGTILSPGDDPLVVTVGALDDQGSTSPSGDTMTSFSSVGPTAPGGWFKPDLVASGRSVVSLRAPGSTVDTQNPSAEIGSSNFVGSGTSFSAAITSGAVALLLDSVRGATPNTVKGLMLAGAAPGPVGDPFVDGHGDLSLPGALALGPNVQLKQFSPSRPTDFGSTVSLASQWALSSWNPANYSRLSGGAWNGGAWNGGAWNGGAWNGGAWNGGAWNGGAWNGGAWNGTAWNGTAWNGGAWNGTAWNGTAWNASTWSGTAWNSATWSGTAWNGTAWNGTAWNGTAWNGTAWNGTAWNGTAWNSGAWNGSAWNGTAWNGTAWNSGAWNGSAWNGTAWNGTAWNSGAWNGSAWNSGAWNGSAWN